MREASRVLAWLWAIRQVTSLPRLEVINKRRREKAGNLPSLNGSKTFNPAKAPRKRECFVVLFARKGGIFLAPLPQMDAGA